MSMGSNNSGQPLKNTRTSLLGTRANWDAAPLVSIALIRKDSRLAMRLLDDCLTGKRLKSRGILMFWLTSARCDLATQNMPVG